MNDENGIVVDYKLTPEVMKEGVAASYDVKYRYRKWLIWVMAVIFICIGVFTYKPTASFSSQFLNIFLVVMGVLYLCNKYFYIRRTVKAVFADRGKLINVKFVAKEDGYQLITDDQEGSCKWKSIIQYYFVDEGILLYPQKNIFYFIPIEASEVTGGTWGDLTAIIQRNVKSAGK